MHAIFKNENLVSSLFYLYCQQAFINSKSWQSFIETVELWVNFLLFFQNLDNESCSLYNFS